MCFQMNLKVLKDYIICDTSPFLLMLIFQSLKYVNGNYIVEHVIKRACVPPFLFLLSSFKLLLSSFKEFQDSGVSTTFSRIHAGYVCLQTPADKANDYADLINYLTVDCRTDLQKVRSIFVWLGCQDIDNTDYSGVTMSDSPRGYMKLIQNYRGSYSAFFTLLCR